MDVPSSLAGKTAGLLGNFDGNPDNDFTLPSGDTLSTNSTERDLMEKFASKCKYPYAHNKSMLTQGS